MHCSVRTTPGLKAQCYVCCRSTLIATQTLHSVGAYIQSFQANALRRAEAIAATVQAVAPVLDVRIVNDKFTGQPRGFAFVHFASIADATRALHAFNVRASS